MDDINIKFHQLSMMNEQYQDNINFLNKIITEDIKFMARMILNKNYNFSFYSNESINQFKILDYLNNHDILNIINYLKIEYTGYDKLYDQLNKYNIIITDELEVLVKNTINQYIDFLETKLATLEG